MKTRAAFESEEYYLWRLMTYPSFQTYDRVGELIKIRGAYIYPEQLVTANKIIMVKYRRSDKGDIDISTNDISANSAWVCEYYRKIAPITSIDDFLDKEENGVEIKSSISGFGIAKVWNQYEFFSSFKYAEQFIAKRLKTT